MTYTKTPVPVEFSNLWLADVAATNHVLRDARDAVYALERLYRRYTDIDSHDYVHGMDGRIVDAIEEKFDAAGVGFRVEAAKAHLHELAVWLQMAQANVYELSDLKIMLTVVAQVTSNEVSTWESWITTMIVDDTLGVEGGTEDTDEDDEDEDDRSVAVELRRGFEGGLDGGRPMEVFLFSDQHAEIWAEGEFVGQFGAGDAVECYARMMVNDTAARLRRAIDSWQQDMIRSDVSATGRADAVSDMASAANDLLVDLEVFGQIASARPAGLQSVSDSPPPFHLDDFVEVTRPTDTLQG